MALEQKLSLKLAQRLVMTPSLQQAIKLLQMTRPELLQTVTQELVENPLLEELEEFLEDQQSDDGEEEAATEGEETTTEATEESSEETPDQEQVMNEIELESYFNDHWDGQRFEGSTREVPEAPPLENTLSRQPDLYDHLLWQLHMTELPPDINRIAELVIGNLSPDGFLMASEEELQQLLDDEDGEFGPDCVRKGLAVVRSLDPAGVGFVELKDSLLFQLRSKGEDREALCCRIIADHWPLFLKRQFPALARELGVKLKELEPVIEQIKDLETRPGRKFDTDRTHYVEPDVYVVKVGDEYVIQLNEDGLPRLRISKAYRKMLLEMKKEGSQKDTQEYIRDKMRGAMWLIKSLDQRQRTIYKVAESIVRQQRDFFDRGIDHLRPMVLRDVASDIGMHESTVSRVVSNKYIHTPRGVYPLKFFFHSGIDRDYGGDISSLTVKRKIAKLIEAEDARRPLSDSALAKALNREGINIARRTVAKYRDELQIPSSTDRKQYF